MLSMNHRKVVLSPVPALLNSTQLTAHNVYLDNMYVMYKNEHFLNTIQGIYFPLFIALEIKFLFSIR